METQNFFICSYFFFFCLSLFPPDYVIFQNTQTKKNQQGKRTKKVCFFFFFSFGFFFFFFGLGTQNKTNETNEKLGLHFEKVWKKNSLSWYTTTTVVEESFTISLITHISWSKWPRGDQKRQWGHGNKQKKTWS